MMPSFDGAAIEAAKAGMTVAPCVYCTNWTWIESTHTGRVFCTRKTCEHAEGLARAAENPRPTYCVMGRMGVDLGTFAIDEFVHSVGWSVADVERIRVLGWLEILKIGDITIMRVT